MKDLRRHVFWLDYFNSTRSRREGRRIPLSQAVKNPTLEELVEAAVKLGYHPEAVQASYPRRSPAPSGYISVEKRGPKSAALRQLATMLARVRGEGKAR